MTIRVTIEVPADEQHAVRVSRGSELLREVQPGERFETYFWKDNNLHLSEVDKLPGPIQPDKPKPELLQEVPQPQLKKYVDPLADTINAVLSSKESYPGFEAVDFTNRIPKGK